MSQPHFATPAPRVRSIRLPRAPTEAAPATARSGPAWAVPWGFLGMLALVAVVETAVAHHPLDFSDPVSLSWQLSARAARAQAPGCSVLGIGDSLVKHAVVPAVLESRTGYRACNLAVARGPAPATYFLLRRALDAGARPRAVVVDFKPSVLVGSPRYNLRYWQEILTPGECLDLVRGGGGSSLLVPIALGRLLPSFRSRLELRGALLAALRGEASPMRLINQVCRRNWDVNRGANVAARNPAFTGAVSAEQHKTLLSHVWFSHRANTAYIRRILDLTARRGIRVYWLLPPLAPALQARREQSGAEAGYLGFVRSLHRAYPHVTVVDGRHSGYDHTVFVDATHLDGRGARSLTTALSTVLQRDLSGSPRAGRWLELPPRSGASDGEGDGNGDDLPLEDVEQSRAIVKAGQGL